MQHTINRILNNFALDAKFVEFGNLMKIYEFLNALTFVKPIFMNYRAMHDKIGMQYFIAEELVDTNSDLNRKTLLQILQDMYF
jgi:hypothetical protein